MRITILSNFDAASALALHYLRSLLHSHETTVFYTDRTSSIACQPKALKELRQFEESLSEVDTLFDSVNAEPLNRINHAPDFRRFSASQPELVISIRHMSILKSAVIAAPRFGVINLHSGLLPQYKGVMATFWAMLNREREIGTTLHFIEDNSIDTGSIIARTCATIDYRKSYFWNTLSMYKEACNHIISVVDSFASGLPPSSTPQADHGTYYGFPTDDDFAKMHFELFEHSDTLKDFLR